MAVNFRRVVTGEDVNGASYVLKDSIAPSVDVRSVHWFTERTADALRDPAPGRLRATPMAPRAGATTFQIIIIPANESQMTREELEAFYSTAFVGTTIMRGDTRRHPGMHRTLTIDYIVVLSGAPTLILSHEEVKLRPHDTVVQRGTEHGWTNHGDEPAVMAVVSIDLAIAGTIPQHERHMMELAALFGLTPTEAAIAISLADGAKLAEIAAYRETSINTVRTHVARLRSKLGVASQAEIVRTIMLTLGAVTNGAAAGRQASAN